MTSVYRNSYSIIDPDFVEETELLLADIAAARGQPVPKAESSATVEHNYPFNFVLTVLLGNPVRVWSRHTVIEFGYF